jgi:hypothetical protein
MGPSAGITRAGLTLKTFIPSSSGRKPNLPRENRSLQELRRIIQQIEPSRGVRLCLHAPTLDSLLAGAQTIP